MLVPGAQYFFNFLLIASRGQHHTTGSQKIEFEKSCQWGSSPVFQWALKELSTSGTKIRRLELRKEVGLLQHEYTVLFFGNPATGSICRLDRSADPMNPLESVISRSGTPHCDTIRKVSHEELTLLNTKDKCLVRLDFEEGSGADISLVLLLCYAIQKDDQGGAYTLQKFNCYFFARTITLGLARHAVMCQALRDGRDISYLKEVDISSLQFATPHDPSSSGDLEKAPFLTHDLPQHLLCTMMWDSVLGGRIRFTERELFHVTLLRDHALYSLHNKKLVAIRDACNNNKALENFRREWISYHQGFTKQEMAKIWEMAWKDLWHSVSQQVPIELRDRKGEEWAWKWDDVCGERVNEKVPYVFATPHRKRALTTVALRKPPATVLTGETDKDQPQFPGILTEIELQEYIGDLLIKDSKKIGKMGLGIESSIFWQVKIAINRVWGTVVSLNPQFNSDVYSGFIVD